MKHFKNCPLWVIAFFMTIAEAAAGYAVSQTAGTAQSLLLGFFIIYPILVTLGFFVVLWRKPANLYAPSEFAGLSPGEYAKALSGLPSDAALAVENAQRNPFDEDAVFKLLDTLLPEEIKQHLILMANKGNELVLPEPDELGHTHRYQIILKGRGMAGGLFSPYKFISKLSGTDFVTVSDSGRRVLLSARGQRFVSWLRNHEREAETFESDLGRWGKEQTWREVLSERIEAHNKSIKTSAEGSA
nr:hypothetical protein [Oceanococcus sp. HetDA_MAG_MS8]